MSELKAPNKQRGFVTLDSIVRSYLMDIGAGMERYEQGKHWAIDAYRDFHFDVAQEIKTVELSMTAWKAVEWPVDYVDWAIIGIRINGEVRAFTNNEALALYFDDVDEDGFPDPQPAADGDEPYNPADLSSTYNQKFYFWNNINRQGSDTGQMYGLAIKDTGLGYFRINKTRKEIQMNPALSSDTKIYLEYISDGLDPCEKTVVNLYAAKLIRLYIHWQRLDYSKSVPKWKIDAAQDRYEKEQKKVQTRIQKVSIADILEVARDAYHPSPVL